MKKKMVLVVMGIALMMMTVSVESKTKSKSIALVRRGRPAATIVLADTPTRAAQFAAAELQHHIEKITGAKLPIATDEDNIKGTRILVGESNATRALGLKNEDFSNQEYLISFRKKVMVLMGRDKDDLKKMDYANPETFPGYSDCVRNGTHYFNLISDEQATCYAVYDFLERFCGVRWYLPTDLGLVCPKEKTLVVKGVDVRRSPAMKHRAIYCATMMPADLSDFSGPLLPWRERALFLYRQRLTGIQPWASSHSFYGYYTRHLKDHPEWFAKGYDKHVPENPVFTVTKKGGYDYNGYPMMYYPNMCYTNEGFIQQVIKSARHYFDTGKTLCKEHAAGDYFSLVPMDSGGKDKFCLCPECQALLHKEPPCNKWRKQYFFWDDQASDYIFNFVNKVAKEVGKTHPDKYLTIAAYHQYYYPPTREPLEPNVAITFGIHAQLRVVPAMGRAINDLLNKWGEESRERPKYLWLWFHRPGRVNPFFPGFMAHNMVKQMKEYHKLGFRGIAVEPAYLSGLKGDAKRAPIVNLLELYVAFKLADDPTLDGNKLIDEFFTLYYGAAARPMQTLYEKIEQVYCDPDNYSFNPYNYFGYQTKDIAWGKLGTKERMMEFGKLMKESKKAAKTEKEKKRVALFEKSVWQRMKAGQKTYLESLSKNRIKNPGFEILVKDKKSGDMVPKSWRTQPNYKCKITIVTDKADVHSGERAVKLETLPNYKKMFINDFNQLTNPIMVSTGEKYKVSFWAKGTGRIKSGFYLYGLKDGRETYVGGASKRFSLSGLDSWQKYSWIYEIPEQVTHVGKLCNVTKLRFAFTLNGKDLCVFIDDCSVVKEPAP